MPKTGPCLSNAQKNEERSQLCEQKGVQGGKGCKRQKWCRKNFKKFEGKEIVGEGEREGSEVERRSFRLVLE